MTESIVIRQTLSLVYDSYIAYSDLTATENAIHNLREMADNLEQHYKQGYVIQGRPFSGLEVNLVMVEDGILEMDIDSWASKSDLSNPVYYGIKNAGVTTVRELVSKTPNELLKVKNFGKVCLAELRQKLTFQGLSLLGDNEC